MQNTKLLENCFRNNIQRTIFSESGDILLVLKNCSMKHTKNRDSSDIHTFQTFPTRQNVQSSTLCFSVQKTKNEKRSMKNWIALWIFFVKFLDVFLKFYSMFYKIP